MGGYYYLYDKYQYYILLIYLWFYPQVPPNSAKMGKKSSQDSQGLFHKNIVL